MEYALYGLSKFLYLIIRLIVNIYLLVLKKIKNYLFDEWCVWHTEYLQKP